MGASRGRRACASVAQRSPLRRQSPREPGALRFQVEHVPELESPIQRAETAQRAKIGGVQETAYHSQGSRRPAGYLEHPFDRRSHMSR